MLALMNDQNLKDESRCILMNLLIFEGPDKFRDFLDFTHSKNIFHQFILGDEQQFINILVINPLAHPRH